jgi:tetratricopeptide (TPR) repeat protein
MTMSRGRTHVAGALAAVLLAVAVSGCATSRAFKRGEVAARAGDWDAAVAYYTKAVQADPDRPDYKIALERSMQAASNFHLDKARELDRKGELEDALVEYRRVLEYAPGNSHAITRRGELERLSREKAEAARQPSRIDQMRERARPSSSSSATSPAST